MLFRSIEISCRQDAVFNFYVNAGLVGAKRTGPGQFNGNFIFSPKEPIGPGDIIEIKVLAGSYTPVTDSDATLMLIEQ